MSGCSPALAQRGPHVSHSKDGDLHHFVSFACDGGDGRPTRADPEVQSAILGHLPPLRVIPASPRRARGSSATGEPQARQSRGKRHSLKAPATARDGLALRATTVLPGRLPGAPSNHFRQRLIAQIGQHVGRLQIAALLLHQ
jgi:hypothetical protein